MRPPVSSAWTATRSPAHEAPRRRAYLPAVAHPRAPPTTSGSRTSGSCRRRAARGISRGWSRGSPPPTRHKAPPRRPRALCDSVEGGALFGRDDPDTGVGARVPTLRAVAGGSARRPPGPELRGAPVQIALPDDDELAAEIANRTMHGVMHIGRVPDGTGGFRGQMAVLVKPQRTARERLHGGDHAVSASDRVPADDATDRARRWRAQGPPDTRPTPDRRPVRRQRMRIDEVPAPALTHQVYITSIIVRWSGDCGARRPAPGPFRPARPSSSRIWRTSSVSSAAYRAQRAGSGCRRRSRSSRRSRRRG